ncbi:MULTISPECIES: TVP38/TMEM64 family protein [Persicobacter]|uniref:TVP38/TMEM64 family membrane protein n=1 Tax=Persicobacter diffluens TaxID=981 RepID=A0AAN5ALL0_9BACT|nr:VTT domain-containing protein [Persicobacter sp. CCB-QB2]GJM60988.1 hypothetical protein PEDI_15400 [Persicobacter diffluens]
MKEIFKILRANGASLGFALGLTALPLIFSGTASVLVLQNEATLRAFDWSQWLLFYALTVITMAFALTPTTLIALISGYLLGWKAIFFIVPSYLLASVLCYFTAQKLDHGNFTNSLREHPQARLILDRLQHQELQLVILTKLSPVLPFAVSNILLAIAGARLRPFFWGAAIGMLPRTLLVIYVGIQANQLEALLADPFSGWQQWIILGLIIISVLGLSRMISKAITQTHENL